MLHTREDRTLEQLCRIVFYLQLRVEIIVLPVWRPPSWNFGVGCLRTASKHLPVAGERRKTSVAGTREIITVDLKIIQHLNLYASIDAPGASTYKIFWSF
jgi:hypothetical protein